MEYLQWLSTDQLLGGGFLILLAVGIVLERKRLQKIKDKEALSNPPLDLNVVKKTYEEDDQTFALYGDSIMRGSYSSDATVQPTALLQAYLPGTTWEDHTMPGRRLLDLIPLITPIQFFTTRYTVIEHGVIDSWQGFDVIENYRKVIARIRAEGSTPIVTGFSHQVVCPALTPEHLYLRSLQVAKLRILCKELNVLYCDLDTVEFHGEGDLIDGVHPARAYSDRLVIRIGETLKEAGLVKTTLQTPVSSV
jgi:hypothetical protein